MRRRTVYKAIEKFEAVAKVRERVGQIESEINEQMGQISDAGMEKLAVKRGEAMLELAQLQRKLVPQYDGQAKDDARNALQHAEKELASLNLYLGFAHKPGNQPSEMELDAVRRSFWSDLMSELVDNFNTAWEEEIDSAMAAMCRARSTLDQ